LPHFTYLRYDVTYEANKYITMNLVKLRHTLIKILQLNVMNLD
jgi:hypothetical protein